MGPRQPLAVLLEGVAVPRLALVGGGGKTSLLFALAGELARCGEAVLCLTTTHIRPPARCQSRSVLLADAFPGAGAFQRELAAYLRAGGGPGNVPGKIVVAAGSFLPEQNKLKGLHPDLADELAARLSGVPVLIEADGAAGRPLKAPAEYEPVIPSCVNTVAAVIGLDAAGLPLKTAAHRVERITALTGLKAEDPVGPGLLARLAVHPEGLLKGAPIHSARRIICNKAELPGGLAFARQAAELARQGGAAWFAGSAREGWCLRLE